MTPAVARDEVQKVTTDRETFLSRMENLYTILDEFGFEADELAEGEAEIGFQIPRDLFDNNLDGLTKELNELRRIIRAFSEVAGNPGEEIEVRTISTSDPLFFFLLGLGTVRLLGGATAWALDQWKKVEEIRNLRAQTAALSENTGTKEIVGHFDNLIEKTIESAIKAETERLVPSRSSGAGRKSELKNHVSLALRSLLARIERGMTVELRLSPPSEAQEEEGEVEEIDKKTADKQAIFRELETIQSALSFPVMNTEPLLPLPRPANDTGEGDNSATE